MMRFLILSMLLGPALLLLGCASGSSTSPGDPVVESDYTIPPYNVLRHGFDLEGVWASQLGSITVGEMGMAFVTVPEGRFVLPVPGTPDLTDAWCTPEGMIFVSTGGEEGERNPIVVWYQDGQWISKQFGPPVSALASARATGGLPMYASAGTRVEWFDGHVWEPIQSSTSAGILDIWPCVEGVWAAMQGGVAFCGGLTGAFTNIQFDGGWYEAISGVAVDSVMAVGGPAGAWRIWKLNEAPELVPVFNSSARLYDIRWVDPEYAFAVGAEGMTVEMNGNDWIPRHVEPPVNLKGVAAWKQNNERFAMAVGDSGGIFCFAQGQWTGGSSPKITCTELSGISPSLLYALNDGRVMKYDGQWQALPQAGTLALHDFCCLGEDTVVAVGTQGIDNFLARYDGAIWHIQWLSSMEAAHDIWAAADQNIFVACDHGTVYSSAWSWAPMNAVQPVQHLRGIWGSSPTSVYVVGAAGTISHWDGSAWTAMSSGTDVNLTAVWGSADDNVVAVGEAGLVLHFDGVSWVSLGSPLTDDINMLWCDGPDNIWVTGEYGHVNHYDGAGWEDRNPQLHPIALTGIWGQGEDLFILAEYDVLLRYQPPPDDLAKALVR